jgi:hypothetical protein
LPTIPRAEQRRNYPADIHMEQIDNDIDQLAAAIADVRKRLSTMTIAIISLNFTLIVALVTFVLGLRQ